jgi:putrescine transport system ATP-binding protein
MREGRILQVGAPGDIYETPASRFVADFIGQVNLMDGKVLDSSADHVVIECADCRHYVGHGIMGTTGMSVSVALRPEKIRLSRTPVPGEFNQARGKVKELSYFGSFTLYHLQLESGFLLKASQSNVERRREDVLAWGDEAWAHWSDGSQIVLTQ